MNQDITIRAMSRAELEVATDAQGHWSAKGILGGRYRVRGWRRPDVAMNSSNLLFLGADEDGHVDLTVETEKPSATGFLFHGGVPLALGTPGAHHIFQVVPEFNDPENYTAIETREYFVEAPWQDLAENGVDAAHFRYVHHTEEVPELESYEMDGPRTKMRSIQRFPTPRGVVDGRIDADSFGPGFSVIRFSGIVDTFLMGCNTPLTANSCHMRFTFTVRKLGDDALSSTVGQAFVAEIDKQVQEDSPIWRNKAYLARPALADTDGPYLKFRKWASQFYAEGVDFDREVYPPLPPATSRPPVEGMVKHSASSRLKDEDRIRANMSASS